MFISMINSDMDPLLSNGYSVNSGGLELLPGDFILSLHPQHLCQKMESPGTIGMHFIVPGS